MPRQTGTYRVTRAFNEEVKAFVPYPLPPRKPALDVAMFTDALRAAETAIARLAIAGPAVPNTGWFLYCFVRKEAVISSQIEGTQATLQDVARFEAIRPDASSSTNAPTADSVPASSEFPPDVTDVCNYVAALEFARREIASPKGLPIGTRLLCGSHRILMRGIRGGEKNPGEIRRTQNWIGGSRPGNARFVPPPSNEVASLLGSLEKWIHSKDSLPPLIKAGLAHVQFETIHPFLDGNGRIGRLLITLLLEHWGVLNEPILYLSLALKRRQQEYYERLAAVRTKGDWEGWTSFFLECVSDAAEDGVRVAQALRSLLERDRERVAAHERSTVAAIRLLDLLPSCPVVSVPKASHALGLTAPPTRKAIELLESIGILTETSGKQRDRMYAYRSYLDALAGAEA